MVKVRATSARTLGKTIRDAVRNKTHSDSRPTSSQEAALAWPRGPASCVRRGPAPWPPSRAARRVVGRPSRRGSSPPCRPCAGAGTPLRCARGRPAAACTRRPSVGSGAFGGGCKRRVRRRRELMERRSRQAEVTTAGYTVSAPGRNALGTSAGGGARQIKRGALARHAHVRSGDGEHGRGQWYVTAPRAGRRARAAALPMSTSSAKNPAAEPRRLSRLSSVANRAERCGLHSSGSSAITPLSLGRPPGRVRVGQVGQNLNLHYISQVGSRKQQRSQKLAEVGSPSTDRPVHRHAGAGPFDWTCVVRGDQQLAAGHAKRKRSGALGGCVPSPHPSSPKNFHRKTPQNKNGAGTN